MDKRLVTEIYLNIEEKGYLGKGRVELLKLIDRHGSILKAAKELGMSYKAAWDMVDAINNLSPEPVVISLSKGKRGGQSVLTEYGKNLIKNYEKIEKFMNFVSEYLSSNIEDVESALKEFRRLNLGLSARNKILVKVDKIISDKVRADIYAKIGDNKVVATITKEALQELNIKEGEEIYFIFKASNVHLSNPQKNSQNNILKGYIKQRIEGNTNLELKVDSTGTIITVIVNKENLDINLNEGNLVYLSIKPEDIIVGKI